MTIVFQRGGRDLDLGEADFREALEAAFAFYGRPKRVLALPPDHTRSDSRAGELTVLAHQMLGDRLVDVMPALGTHEAMTPKQLDYMFPGLPHDLVRVHKWRTDVQTLGEVDAEFVAEATEGIYRQPWKAQVNRLLVEGGHDLILSLGQVVPHEVIGMANYTKNVFVGTGGKDGINESHYLSALYGTERVMGRCNTPLRRILNRAQDLFCQNMPLMYVLTVVESLPSGEKKVRGLFVGNSHDTFFAAGELAAAVNCFVIDRAPQTVVVTMDAKKYSKTWLANKAIYRTRMLVREGGRLVVIAPGVARFGDDLEIDALIRKYGYRTTPEVLKMVEQHDDLRANLSAAAHLLHGTSENKFEVVYAPGTLSREEIESVGYSYADAAQMQSLYRTEGLRDGWHTAADGSEFYYISDPGLGLWMRSDHPHVIKPGENAVGS
ncbi:MAG: lactate racemase domain-containing protein [Pirellulales bacterium]